MSDGQGGRVPKPRDLDGWPLHHSLRIESSADATPASGGEVTDSSEDRVFESAAELFGMLATPIRLRIISAVCTREKNVSQLLAEIDTTQPNMSQHLATLYRSGVLAKRRDGTQIYYRLQSERVAMLCRAVCTQVAIEIDSGDEMPSAERLMPLAHR
jgi:DNA-binding transcriptional ArsR family regulator